MATPRALHDQDTERDRFYDELAGEQLGALWTVLGEALTQQPRVRATPYVWRFSVVRPQVMRAGKLVSAEEAERRVIVLRNPGIGDEISATDTLYAGVQLLLPGEIARTHRHTPSAIRFIIEGSGAFTTVDGEPTVMEPGDFVTTPNWSWHDHGNRSDEPMLWLDGLDIPLVTAVAAVFYEEFREHHGTDVKPPDRGEESSKHRWGRGLRATFAEHDHSYSPVLNYRWREARETLSALRHDEGSRFDGVMLEYTNPLTGGPVLPTMSAFLQLLRDSEHTEAHRHVSSVIYHAAEGSGESIVAGVQLRWSKGDTFAVPAWAWHEHRARSGDAVLFSFTDRPALRSLALEREEPHPERHQS